MLAEAHYDSQDHKKSSDCGICASCQFRQRWAYQYQKFIDESISPETKKWAKKIIEQDKKILVCQRQFI